MPVPQSVAVAGGVGANATLVVVGDTTMAEIKPKLEKLFGKWASGTVPKKNLAKVPLPAGRSLYIVDQPGAIQSTIMAGELAPPKNNPDEAAIEVMNSILGGMFTSRLNMNLREAKHWSYGVSSMFFGGEVQRPFILYAPVQADKTKESMIEPSGKTQAWRAVAAERPTIHPPPAAVWPPNWSEPPRREQ